MVILEKEMTYSQLSGWMDLRSELIKGETHKIIELCDEMEL